MWDRQARRTAAPPKPAVYDGCSSGEVFLEDYIHYVRKSIPVKAYDSDYAASFSAFLTDRAKAWYRELSEPDQDHWPTLSTLFKARFVDYYAHERETAYKDRSQGEGETVADYSNAISRLMTAAKVDPAVKLHIYINNLKDGIGSQVREQQPKTLIEAETMAKKVESLFLASQAYSANNSVPTKSKAAAAAPGNSKDMEDRIVSKLVDRVLALGGTKATLAAIAGEPPSQPKARGKRRPRPARPAADRPPQDEQQSTTRHLMEAAAHHGAQTPSYPYLSVPNPYYRPEHNHQAAPPHSQYQGNY